MDDFAAQMGLVIGVLGTFFAGPGIALTLLIHRKRRARRRRRSPLGIDLLRGPGHSLREQIDDANQELTWDVGFLMSMPLLLLAVFLAQAHMRSLNAMTHLVPLYVLGAAVIAAWTIRKMYRTGQMLDKLTAGYDAEVAIGQELDQLGRRGAFVFHDVPADGFNIDHVVISTQGIFAVETKGFTKQADARGRTAATVTFDGSRLVFPNWTTSEPLAQADRQARWLSRWASSATGDTINAMPVLALPGWFVDRRGRGDVRVYSGRELGQLLDAVGASPLSAAAVQRAAHQIDQRCRTVAPRYKGKDAQAASGAQPA